MAICEESGERQTVGGVIEYQRNAMASKWRRRRRIKYVETKIIEKMSRNQPWRRLMAAWRQLKTGGGWRCWQTASPAWRRSNDNNMGMVKGGGIFNQS
jgi:hypothetical protein